MKFTGKNFQAWPEFNLDLKGFVVMIGSSFSGKSALFRALRGILRNEIPEQRVRHGTKELELELEVDGKTIKAVRKASGSTKYLTDKGEYTSLAKGVPEGLKALNAGEVQVGDYSIDPIFASQFGEQFLLQGSGPTELNTILGAFASTEKLETGKKQANLLVSQKNAEAKLLAEQVGDAEERKGRLEHVYEGGIAIDAAVKTLGPKILFMERVIDSLGECTTSMTRLVPLRHLEASLAIPDTREAERLEATIFWIERARHAERRARRLKVMDTELEHAVDCWNSIIGLSRRAKAFTEISSLSSRLDKARELDAAKKLNGVVGEMENLLVAAINLQASIRYTSQAVQLIQRVADKKSELTRLEASLKELHETHGLCPKCGEPLEHECQI